MTMKNILKFSTASFLCFTAAVLPSKGEDISIHTPGISMLLRADKGETLKFEYFGAKVSDTDAANIREMGTGLFDAYPAYGLNCQIETAIAVRHADGNMTLDLRVAEVITDKSDDFIITTVVLKDNAYPFTVKVCYKAYSAVDMLETWTEITNNEKKPVVLNQFSSGYLPIRRGDVWLSSLSGQWADEGVLTEEPLLPGMKVIKNKDGVRNSQTAHSEVMFSLDGKPQQNSGRVIGAALCYSGNYRLRIDTGQSDWHHFFAGINEENSMYNLHGGETFVTPVLALTYSGEGMSGASRNFHKWARKYRLAHGDRLRKTLLNSWEGVYLDIKEPEMHQMMADIASMGGELFVMDDGWFGKKYRRVQDDSSLGDWVVDDIKLPNGIQGLLDEAEKLGIAFGIWYEPEMTNIVSELYDKHPDWVIKSTNRALQPGRGNTQLVLDLSNPRVQDFIVAIFDRLMKEYPGIDYVKWDANMEIKNHGSQYLTADNQSHLYIEYHRGFESVCRRIRDKYPELTIQACASGGGRANYGVLPWFDEFWVSDNTDALQRIFMQWGTSYFFPAIAMASHISCTHNHTTHRNIPLKYRIDVAMSARLGLEMQPKDMTDEEKQICRRAIADYKMIRPVVQFGDIYRLISPYDDKGIASLMYVDEQKNKSVFFWWKTEHFHNQNLPRVLMAGLNPEGNYRVRELNRTDNTALPFEGKTFSGDYLMNVGLEIPCSHNLDWLKQTDYSSRVLYLELQ